MKTGTSVAWPKGGTPPIANPVAARAVSASAFLTGSPATPASRLSSSLFAPLTSATTGRPPATNTSDLTICPSSQPTACAASTAVRVPSGNSLTAMPAPEADNQASNRFTGMRIGGFSVAIERGRTALCVSGGNSNACRRDRRGRVYRLAPLRAVAHTRPPGRRDRQLYGLLRARAQGAESRRREGQSRLHLRRARPCRSPAPGSAPRRERRLPHGGPGRGAPSLG